MKFLKPALRLAGRYGYHVVGLFGAVTAFIDVATGRDLSHDTQLVYIGALAAWICLHAVQVHLSYQWKDISRRWEENSESWRNLYEQVSSGLLQRMKGMWS